MTFYYQGYSYLIKERTELFPITKEKYFSFTKHIVDSDTTDKNDQKKTCIKLRFIDS